MATPPKPDKNLTSPAWENAVQAALDESNPLKLGEKLFEAEAALAKRLKELKDSPADAAERQAIEKATLSLQAVQAKVFGPSDWQI